MHASLPKTDGDSSFRIINEKLQNADPFVYVEINNVTVHFVELRKFADAEDFSFN